MALFLSAFWNRLVFIFAGTADYSLSKSVLVDSLALRFNEMIMYLTLLYHALAHSSDCCLLYLVVFFDKVLNKAFVLL